MERMDYRSTSAYRINTAAAPERRQGRDNVTPMPSRKRSDLKRVHRRSPLKAFSVLLCAFLAMLPIVAMIALNAKITEVNEKIMQVDTKISRVTGDNTRLELEIERMMSIKNVEDYAITELGMQKLSRSQIEYIKLNTEDKIEVKDSKESLFDKFIACLR